MTLQEIRSLYLHRQSCRSYDSKPDSEELLKEICAAALLAPSACNSQPWTLYAVTGERAKKLCAGVQEGGANKFASEAPAFVAVVEREPELLPRVRERYSNREWMEYDVGNLTAHLILAADAAGLGTCIIGMRNENVLREVLGLKNNDKVPYIVSIGYPKADCEIRKKQRKELSETLVILN